MSNPPAACGPVEGFVRSSWGFRCGMSNLHTENLYFIGIKLAYVVAYRIVVWNFQNWIKLFEVIQTWTKMFHLAQIWIELLPFGQSWLSLLEFRPTQIFPIYGTFLTSPKFEWSCPNLLKFHWDCWNLPKWFWFHPNLNKTFIVHPDIFNSV